MILAADLPVGKTYALRICEELQYEEGDFHETQGFD